MIRFTLCAALLASLSADAADQTTVRAKHVKAAYREAFGREATEDEVKHWEPRKDWTDRASLVEHHRNWLRGNDVAAKEAVVNSYKFVFGREPVKGEMNHWLPYAKKGMTCNEMVANHQKYIAATAPAEVQANSALMGKLKDINLKIDASGNIVRNNGEIVAKAGDYVLSHNGGAIHTVGASKLLGNDGGSMVAAGAGNMVAAGGGNVLPSGAGGLVGNNGNTARGYTLTSVGGKPLPAGTVLLDINGKGVFSKK